ncbi:MAG: NAD(P)-dependent oxidoreductase [Caulobacterales bacterium 32-69-10]|nr:MAG: NAD(P)-dependent oxidoreductase [Caulobacterales bacterium 32-69-10]
MRLFIFGYGFTGHALERRLAPKGWDVVGTTRSAPRDYDGADAVLIAAPPTAEGCPGLAALAPALAANPPAWLGYLSTTGVYGDRGGGWVFETSDLLAHSVEGARRAAAERGWLGHGAAVFRLPGIYGPGRSAFDRLRDGTAKRLVKPGHVFSRIHVDDLAAGLEASIARPRAGGLYNLTDDEPAPAHAVTTYAARLLGIEPPPETAFDETTLSPMARRFWAESKRVSNARAKAELGWRPAYPSYREGLAAVLAAGG